MRKRSGDQRKDTKTSCNDRDKGQGATDSWKPSTKVGGSGLQGKKALPGGVNWT